MKAKKLNAPPVTATPHGFRLKYLNAPARSSLMFTVTNLLSKGASLVFTPIFTRLLTPEEYGEYSLFSSYLSLALVTVTLEIPGSVIMRAFQKNRGLESLTALTASAIPLLLTAPAVILLTNRPGGLAFPHAPLFLALSLLSLSFINLYTSSAKFLYRTATPMLLALVQSVAAPLISIALLSSSANERYGGALIKVGTGSIVSAAVAAILFSLALTRALREARHAGLDAVGYFGFARGLYKTLLSLSLPLLPYYFSVMIISQADKLIISERLGSEALGKYALAYSAGIALTAVTGGITSALFPWIMRKVRAGDISTVRRALGAIISIGVPAVILFLCAAPEVFAALAPKSYGIALPVLFITALVPLPLAISGALCSIAVAREKALGILLSGITAAGGAVVLDLALVGRAPLFAPAIVTAVSYTALMLFESISVRKILGKFPINVNKALQKLAFLAFSTAAVFALRLYPLARAVIAALALVYLIYMLLRSKWLLGEKGDLGQERYGRK